MTWTPCRLLCCRWYGSLLHFVGVSLDIFVFTNAIDLHCLPGSALLCPLVPRQVVLVRPLSWCGLILPLTPSKLHPYIEAPIPLIVGVTALPEDVDLSDCVIVDLARGHVREADTPVCTCCHAPCP
jgi:hypothetical protein